MNYLSKYLKYKKKYLIMLGSSNTEIKKFKLVIKPYISGEDNLGNTFGYYYSDIDTKENRDDFSLNYLLDSDDNFKKVCADISIIWLETCQKSIFSEIGNFEYLLDIEYGKDLYKLLGLNLLDNGNIEFIFQESYPGSINESFLTSLVEEVKSGGDTWDCRDFGDVNYQVVEINGFLDKWLEIINKYGITNIKDINIRVSLSDPNVFIEKL